MVNRTPPTSVFILAFDECDELDVVGPTAVLRPTASSSRAATSSPVSVCTGAVG
jgi:hypothetical protein